MTVSTTTNKVRINGNGITTSFPFQFPILKNDFSDLKVYRIDIDEETQEEIATLLSITTNYTITVIKNLEQRITSGYINLINENNEPLALTENQALFIMREEEITQDLDLYENQKFPYKNLENMLDKIIVINQQQQEQIDRTLKTSSFFTGSLSETITSPVENRSLKWKKKQDGTFYVSNSDTDVDEVYNQIVNNSNIIAVGQNINNVNINANNINNVNTTANNINNVNNVAENINALNSINNWISTSGGVVNYYIGQVIQVLCSSNYIPSGTLPCDGTEYNKTQFPDLWNNYLTATSPLLQTCTYEEYQTNITNNGFCEKFAIDTDNNKFKVPILNNVMYQNTDTTLPVLGNGKVLGLTNGSITGGLSADSYNAQRLMGSTGTPIGSDVSTTAPNSGSTIVGKLGVVQEANNSGLIAQNKLNATLKFFVVVANGEINQSQMDWSTWATGLNSKANIDLNNVANNIDYVIERGSNENGWYEKYKSGKIRQGGQAYGNGTYSNTLTFPTPFANTNYIMYNGSTEYSGNIIELAQGSWLIRYFTGDKTTTNIKWQALFRTSNGSAVWFPTENYMNWIAESY